MDEIESISFQIISAVRTAKNMYLKAIRAAKEGNFEEVDRLMRKGTEVFIEGHRAHGSLIQKESSGEKVELSLLLIHAEDHLMATETLKLITKQFIDFYRDKYSNKNDV